jgi:hypothetical protein
MNVANHWLDIGLVTVAVAVSLGYAIYAMGPKKLRDWFTRWVTRYFGLRAAKLFSGSTGCDNCGGIVKTPKRKFPTQKLR